MRHLEKWNLDQDPQGTVGTGSQGLRLPGREGGNDWMVGLREIRSRMRNLGGRRVEGDKAGTIRLKGMAERVRAWWKQVRRVYNNWSNVRNNGKIRGWSPLAVVHTDDDTRLLSLVINTLRAISYRNWHGLTVLVQGVIRLGESFCFLLTVTANLTIPIVLVTTGAAKWLQIVELFFQFVL